MSNRVWTPEMAARAEELLRAHGAGEQRGWYSACISVAAQLGIPVERLRAWARRSGTLAKLRAESPPAVEAPTVLTPPPTPAEGAEDRLRRETVRLRDSVRELTRKLNDADRKTGVVEELAELLPGYVRPISIDATARATLLARAEPREEAESVDSVAMWTDQHADRRISLEGTWGLERYDFNVFTARLWKYAKTVRAYATRHLPNYAARTLWVLHLGDAVNGDIHDAKLRNSFPNSLEAAIATGDVQAQALLYLAGAFERVVVVCVPGNHGRQTARMEYTDPYDNLDYLVARTMQLRLAGTPAEERVQIIAPRSYTAYVDIRGWLWALNHGTGVKGTWGIPWYGFERREGRVQRLVETLDRRVDMFAYGHFHTPMSRPGAIHGGAWYYTDEWALNVLSGGHEPVQQLLMVSERFPVQMMIPIHLRDAAREEQLRAGLWAPPFDVPPMLMDPNTPMPATGALPVIS